MKRLFFVLVIVIFGPLLFASDYESYQVVCERNIFDRDRTPPNETIAPANESEVEDVGTGSYALKGIAFDGHERIIFIENEITGETMRAAVGTYLPSGVVKEISIDKVMYEENEMIRSIYIGDIFCETITR